MTENDYSKKEIPFLNEMRSIKVISINKVNGSIVAFLPYLKKDGYTIANTSKVDDLILDSVKKIYPNSFFLWDKKIVFNDEDKVILSTLYPDTKKVNIHFSPYLDFKTINDYSLFKNNLIVYEFPMCLRVNKFFENEYLPDVFFAEYQVKESPYVSSWLDNVITI